MDLVGRLVGGGGIYTHDGAFLGRCDEEASNEESQSWKIEA